VSRILIVEDEAVIRGALHRLLERSGYEISEAGSVEQARTETDLQSQDLIIADLRLPGADGTELIDLADGVPVLIMTSYASVRSAVDAMRRGAVDYIAKPFDHDELLLLVRRSLAERRRARQRNALKSDVDRAYPVKGMVGDSPPMQEVRRRVIKVAPTDTTVLILGESGTGKELVARAIHEQSRRCEGPFIAVNCASIPDTLIESELFGHEKGAFTGADGPRKGLVEAAGGGTLFLDEVAELPLTAQANLLRVLQENEIRRVGASTTRKVDVRLIAATHRDVKQLLEEDRFRSDLYFRLRVMEIALPPLRDRGQDLLLLAKFLLQKTCHRLNRSPMQYSPEALDAITAHDWPGNVRELENAVERAVIMADEPTVRPELMGIDLQNETAAGHAAVSDLSLGDYFRQFVLQHQQELTETEIARRLGISRKTLWERRQKYGIPRPHRSP
jgi:DNA-binding NtrC family response regulator